MKDCYCYLGLHFILLDDSSQSYILKLRDRGLKSKVDKRVQSSMFKVVRSDGRWETADGRGRNE